ncbi:hypothetical protein LJC59_08400, partial [Desulfovibrio sp. OttesenSCG-928-A18]|nr:hypothetical protein [Desulfovibrio sp. OttesenSCG-928-A18]
MYDKAQHDRLRRLWRSYHDWCDCLIAEYREEQGLSDDEFPFDAKLPPFPEVLRGLTCGARTRKGTPCKLKDLYRSGRCKFHGGLSTGP